MSLWTKLLFRIQCMMGRAFAFTTLPLMYLAIKIAGYRINNLDIIRKEIKKLQREHKGPWIICANHLTMIDSVLLAYAMYPLYHYLFRYRYVPWNIPERKNVNRIKVVAILCYLFKCIPVIRGGNRVGVNRSLAKCNHVLEKGESLMIFPEGTRSRTGFITTDNLQYSVGRLVHNFSDCRVLCIYMRGEGQKTYSTFPKFKDNFSIYISSYKAESRFKGLRAYRDCSLQIIEKLIGMEKNHFDTCRQ
ncbi:1-acyl-sn-glycerol-3-phosphate acyltransferase [Candidatus Magnetomorum sp. HK-1]|nr:1-acyl-sn-glycerol-3-phosphate acyltransferase [Candidatus Magnetomorum sp. HK-1]